MGWKVAFHALLSRPLPSLHMVSECRLLHFVCAGRKQNVFPPAEVCVSHLNPPQSFHTMLSLTMLLSGTIMLKTMFEELKLSYKAQLALFSH